VKHLFMKFKPLSITVKSLTDKFMKLEVIELWKLLSKPSKQLRVAYS
jgi:hypothetical protein